jgi:hypothetical protein
MFLTQASDVVKTATQIGNIQVDWTINIGHIGTAIVALFVVWRIFIKLQYRVDQIEKDMKEFRDGIKSFQDDFRQLGAQVVHALIAIGRLEGRTYGDPPTGSEHPSMMMEDPTRTGRGRHRDK